jgi:hypothetical protein
MNDLKEDLPWEEILSRNIQLTKNTFSGAYWKESDSTKGSLAIKHVNHFVEHRPMIGKLKR